MWYQNNELDKTTESSALKVLQQSKRCKSWERHNYQGIYINPDIQLCSGKYSPPDDNTFPWVMKFYLLMTEQCP